MIPPVFQAYHDEDIKGFTQDIDKANKLLDDAGYKDVDGDGIREDKDGNKLTINFASMSGGETAQPLADYYTTMERNWFRCSIYNRPSDRIQLIL